MARYRYRRPGRPIRSVALLLAVASLASCSMHRELVARPAVGSSVTAPTWRTTEIANGSHRVLGYRTVDGQHHRYESTVRLVGDSLEFVATSRGAEVPRVVLPSSEVAAVDLFTSSPGSIGLSIPLFAVMALAVVYGIALVRAD